MPSVAPPPAAAPATRPSRDGARPAPRPRPPAAPPLSPWSRTWRYLAAFGIAALLWVFASVDFVPRRGACPTTSPCGWARRCSSTACSGSSRSASCPVAAATHRRWRLVVPIALSWVTAVAVYEGLWRPSVMPEASSTGFVVLSGGVAVGMVATCIATGFYVGARRELLETLRQRAETAEREQVLKAE